MKIIIFILFAALITFSACSDGIRSEWRDAAIYGILQDPYGNPISDADIVLKFETTESDIEIPTDDLNIIWNPANNYAKFRYGLEQESYLKAYLYDPVLQIFIDSLVHEQLNPGLHAFQFDLNDYSTEAGSLRNGIYEIIVESEGKSSSEKLLIYSEYTNYITATVKTDSKGQFVLPYEFIQLKVPVMKSTDIRLFGPIEISNEIDIYAIKYRKEIAHLKLKIDKNKVEDIVLKVPIE